MFYAFYSHSCPPYKNHQKTKRGGISPLRSIFPMSVFFLMPFGMIIQLSLIKFRAQGP